MGFISDIQSIAKKVGNVIKESYGPLSALDPTNSKSKFGLYRYPLDVGSGNYPHTVEFHFYKPEPAGMKESTYKPNPKNANTEINVSGDAYLFAKTLDNTGGLRYNQNLQLKDQLRLTDWTRRASLTNIIAMYLPRQGPQDTFNVSYSDVSVTQASGAAGFFLEAGRSVIKSWDADVDMQWKPVIMEALGKLAEGSSLVGDGAALANLGLQVTQGYAINPQMEILFSGADFRKFMFQFKMLPRSQKEADEMIKIVKTFKYHASPEYLNSGGRYIAPPSYVDVYFKYNGVENERLPMKVSTCVLSAVDLDMGSGTEQFVSFRDGTPVEIGMQIQLTELELMHKELRLRGY